MYIQTNGSLEIVFNGRERLFALRDSLVIPKDHIATISWHDQFEFGSMWRVGGVGAPGLLYAGYYRENREWQFMYVVRPRGIFRTTARNILHIQTHDFRYHNVYLTVDQQTGERIVAWSHKFRK